MLAFIEANLDHISGDDLYFISYDFLTQNYGILPKIRSVEIGLRLLKRSVACGGGFTPTFVALVGNPPDIPGLDIPPRPELAACIETVPNGAAVFYEAVEEKCGIDLSKYFDDQLDNYEKPTAPFRYHALPAERKEGYKACMRSVEVGIGTHLAAVERDCGFPAYDHFFGLDRKKTDEEYACIKKLPDFDVGYIDRVQEICRYDLLDPKF